jgi:riboflavin biosynthesis pyrimidine reductase
VLDCSGRDPERVDLGVAMRLLAARGLTRVLTEGGPSLLGAFIDRDLLDEMCLTTAPLLAGGGAVRVAAGSTEALARMRSSHLLTDDEGYLYARYVRVR